MTDNIGVRFFQTSRGMTGMVDKILVLSMNSATRSHLSTMLGHMGREALAMSWQSFAPRAFGRRHPSLVVADVDGAQAGIIEKLFEPIRKSWGQEFPVIALSRVRKFHEIAAILDAGADFCLPLPPDAALLGQKITRCLNKAAVSELQEDLPRELVSVFSAPGLIRLGDLAAIHQGVAPRHAAFRRLAPPDHEWRGVLSSGVTDRFFVGRPESYMRWSRFHLFRLPDPAEYAIKEKVVLRRIGPPLAAAVDRSRLPAGADLFALAPKEGVSAGFLACLLNSRLMDFYFNRLAGVGAGGRLRVEDLRNVPLPRPGEALAQDLGRTAALLAHYGPNPQGGIDRDNKDELWRHMEDAVFGLYGVNQEARRELAALCF